MKTSPGGIEAARRKRALLHQRVLLDAQALIDDGTAPELPSSAARGGGGGEALVSAPTLRLLLEEVDPRFTLADGVAEALEREAAAFVDRAITEGAKVAARRSSALDLDQELETRDVSLYLRLKTGAACGRRAAGPERWKRPRVRGGFNWGSGE